MHFNVYDVFYSLNSHQHVSAAILAIFRVILHVYNGISVVSCAFLVIVTSPSRWPQ